MQCHQHGRNTINIIKHYLFNKQKTYITPNLLVDGAKVDNEFFSNDQAIDFRKAFLRI